MRGLECGVKGCVVLVGNRDRSFISAAASRTELDKSNWGAMEINACCTCRCDKHHDSFSINQFLIKDFLETKRPKADYTTGSTITGSVHNTLAHKQETMVFKFCKDELFSRHVYVVHGIFFLHFVFL